MKMKKIVISKYLVNYKDRIYAIENVTVLLPIESNIDPEKFDQYKSDYYLADDEIERIYKVIECYRKHKENASGI